MLAEQLISLKKERTAGLKITSDLWAPMVNCRSTGPWMLFQVKEDRKKPLFKSLSSSGRCIMHGWDWLFDIANYTLQFRLWNLNVIHSIAGQTLFASAGAPRSEAVALYDSKIGRGPVQGQLVYLALALCMGCDWDHETLSPHLGLTRLSTPCPHVLPSLNALTRLPVVCPSYVVLAPDSSGTIGHWFSTYSFHHAVSSIWASAYISGEHCYFVVFYLIKEEILRRK